MRVTLKYWARSLRLMLRILPGVGILFLGSCKDFIEPSIEDKKVFINAPADSTQTSTYLQTFWWEEIEDALSYRVQIVTPGFANASRLIMDTLVTGNKFIYTLDPGVYEWRIRGENGSSSTLYATQMLTVFESNISSQVVQVKAPANGLLTNMSETEFAWNNLYGAKVYRLQVDTNSFRDEKVLYFDQTTTALDLKVHFSKDQTYQWRVRAEQDSAVSKWSTVSVVRYDTTPPSVVTLVGPAKGASAASPVSLQWKAMADASSYQLYVYRSDTTTSYHPSFPMTLKVANYTFKEGTFGEVVYWKVRAADLAGNWGSFSELRSFTIQ